MSINSEIKFRIWWLKRKFCNSLDYVGGYEGIFWAILKLLFVFMLGYAIIGVVQDEAYKSQSKPIDTVLLSSSSSNVTNDMMSNFVTNIQCPYILFALLVLAGSAWFVMRFMAF
jgi:hypothetical protein